MEIKIINDNDLDYAIDLVWRVFLKYEAPDYTEEGVETFRKTINDRKWIKERILYGYYLNNKLVGVIATKDKHHIALFFVEGEYHRMGIGTKLFNLVDDLNPEDYMTVNSSPYAHEVYKRLGFSDTDTMQEVSGMKFYPMRKVKKR